jgi:hypothetical protein
MQQPRLLERAIADEQGIALVGKARQWRLVDRLSAPVSSLASNQTQRAGEEQELALGILEQLQEVIDDLERDRDIGRAENVAAAIELIDALVQARGLDQHIDSGSCWSTMLRVD